MRLRGAEEAKSARPEEKRPSRIDSKRRSRGPSTDTTPGNERPHAPTSRRDSSQSPVTRLLLCRTERTMITNVSNPARRFEVLPHPPRFLPFLHPRYRYQEAPQRGAERGESPVGATVVELVPDPRTPMVSSVTVPGAPVCRRRARPEFRSAFGTATWVASHESRVPSALDTFVCRTGFTPERQSLYGSTARGRGFIFEVRIHARRAWL